MGFRDELISEVNVENVLPDDLVEKSKINEYEVPENLKNIKNRIAGLLNFRNENKDLNPNCNELMDITVDLNNSLAKELKSESPDIEACDSIKSSFGVLYGNVIDHALLSVSKLASKDSSIYKTFEGVIEKLNSPKRINLETKEYLKVLVGVNFFQRERAALGEAVQPNSYESGVIEDFDEYDIPDDLIDVTNRLKSDVKSPELLIDELTKDDNVI